LDLRADEFKKRFPHLAEEFKRSEMALQIDRASSPEKGKSTRLRGFAPEVIDFLRRCDDADQGREIITFLHKRSEITDEYAKQLLAQLEQKGIRSFGEKKEDGYYLKQDSR
jgi:hypothetical protein